jgi:hypothetical protein
VKLDIGTHYILAHIEDNIAGWLGMDPKTMCALLQTLGWGPVDDWESGIGGSFYLVQEAQNRVIPSR